MKALPIIALLVLVIVSVFLVFGFEKFPYSKKADDKIEEEIADYNFVIGTQTVGAKYKFTEKSSLVETAQAIRDMGSNLLKFSMNPRYSGENYGLPKNDKIKSLKDLAILEPSMYEVLHMDFKYYHIWAYGFSQYTQEPEGEKIDTAQIKFIGGYSDYYADKLYKELYDLTAYLLTEFSGTDKIFYLGHWEGDWHLRWDYDRTKDADPKTLEGMIKWEKVRQRAIDDAKRDTPSKNVEIYNYIEVNLVRKGMEDKESKTVTNSILPEVNPDYVSYSSYDATNPYKTEQELSDGLKEALDYIESFLTEKPNLPKGKRVWIGEYGNPALKYPEDIQDLRSRWTIRTGLEWGTPFILYWEMYNNEINSESNQHVGYWMITDKGDKQKIWYTHSEFYNESKQYLNNYYLKNRRLPSWDEYRASALNFQSLSTSNQLSK